MAHPRHRQLSLIEIFRQPRDSHLLSDYHVVDFLGEALREADRERVLAVMIDFQGFILVK